LKSSGHKSEVVEWELSLVSGMATCSSQHTTVVVRVGTEFLVANYFYSKSLRIWKKIVFNFCWYDCC